MTVASGDTYAERAAAGTLGTRQDTTPTGLTSDPLLAPYRILRERGGAVSGLTSANQYLLLVSGAAAINTNVGVGVFTFDPSSYTIANKVTKARVSVSAVPNTIDPGCTFTTALYPIAGVGGATTSLITVTLGTVVSGSSVAITPGAGSGSIPGSSASSSDFTPPASGLYALIMTLSTNQAANSLVSVRATLSVHHV